MGIQQRGDWGLMATLSGFGSLEGLWRWAGSLAHTAGGAGEVPSMDERPAAYFLDNEVQQRVLRLEDPVDAMEQAYADWAHGLCV